MKSRREAVQLIREQFDMSYLCSRTHYGRQELRELMDFIYEEPPRSLSEYVPAKLEERAQAPEHTGDTTPLLAPGRRQHVRKPRL